MENNCQIKVIFLFPTGFQTAVFVFTTLASQHVPLKCRVLLSSRLDEQTVLRWDNCRSSRMPERWLFISSKRDPVLPYKTEKAEIHPNPVGNGQSTIEFFRNSFAMTGREVGIDKHLFDGKYWFSVQGGSFNGSSHFWPAPLRDQHVPLYMDQVFVLEMSNKQTKKQCSLTHTWTSKQTNLWTNDYYKMMTGRPRLSWYMIPLFSINFMTFRSFSFANFQVVLLAWTWRCL